MLLDLTLKVTPAMRQAAPEKEDPSLMGHLGTHFDAMDREFPLEYTCRRGIVFDVSAIRGRDVEIGDLDLDKVQKGAFVAFFTGRTDEEAYGTKAYFADHPQLSHALITALLEKEVSVIGVDCSGIRRGKEHTPADQLCADHGVFVVENLCGLKELLSHGARFTAYTYPVRYSGMTGLPCRVLAEPESFPPLVRKKQALTPAECIEILKKEKRGVLSVHGDGGYPYGMPMNHFYNEEDGKIYFHCGKGGHRAAAMDQNPKASFCTYTRGEREGDWALRIRSVIVFGCLERVTDQARVKEIAEALCRKFTDDEEYIRTEIRDHARHTVLLALTPEHISGKSVLES